MRTIQPNNPYDVKNPYRYQAIIYLAEVKKESNRFIADLFGYAISTIRTYRWKYHYYLEESKELFEPRVIDEEILNPNDYDLDSYGKFFYLVKFYDYRGNFLVSKIGTTERSLEQRLKEHFKSGTPYNRMGACFLKIDKVYSCPRNPKGLESYIRGLLMLKYDLIGNDQFPYDLDWEELEEEIQNYLQKSIDK